MKTRSHLVSVLAVVLVAFGALGAVLAVGWAPLLGLDLRGGISVVYRPARKVSSATLDETISIIRNRVDAFGVAEPNISTQGGDIVVQLPGIKNRAEALAIIGETAQLYFRPVLCQLPLGPSSSKGKPAPTLTGPPPSCSANVNFAKVPNTPRSLDLPGKTVLLPAAPGTTPANVRYEMGPAGLSGNGVKSAFAQLLSTGQWVVQLNLKSAGAVAFDRLGKQQFHKEVAVVLDGVVESAPEIQPSNSTFQSFNGVAQISGTFTHAQASQLALVLNYGALSVQLDQQTVQSVSPTLGEASLRAGIIAGLVGLALVMAYTILYYRALGVVVVLGLVTTACLLYAIISTLSQTAGLSLDLSGATGLIVSVGVTVDSYIVYFERLKDEVRAGNSIRTSVDRSFRRAFQTIVAADLVSLIGALALYVFSVAQVRGFAFFLGLSTLLDVVTSWFFTRPLVILLGRSRWFTEAPLLGVARGLAAPAADATPARATRAGAGAAR